LTNSFSYRGYDPRQPQVVIVVGFGLSEARKLFESWTVAAQKSNPFVIENEESRDHLKSCSAETCEYSNHDTSGMRHYW